MQGATLNSLGDGTRSFASQNQVDDDRCVNDDSGGHQTARRDTASAPRAQREQAPPRIGPMAPAVTASSAPRALLPSESTSLFPPRALRSQRPGYLHAPLAIAHVRPVGAVDRESLCSYPEDASPSLRCQARTRRLQPSVAADCPIKLIITLLAPLTNGLRARCDVGACEVVQTLDHFLASRQYGHLARSAKYSGSVIPEAAALFSNRSWSSSGTSIDKRAMAVEDASTHVNCQRGFYSMNSMRAE